MLHPVASIARLTPPGRGAVAVVRVEGPRATEVVGACFRSHSGRPLAEIPLERITLGRWGGAEGEELVVCRRSEQCVEVHPHGGLAAVNKVVESLQQLGAAERTWQEWITAAEDCPLAAEARIALAAATTRRTAAILLDQYHGALRRDVEQATGLLREGDAIAARIRLLALRQRYGVGEHLVQPWRVVLAGPPNVGKSSLVNALVGYRRAIVYDQPGTTRDVVSVRTAIEGWPVELSDTAGLRASSDPLEVAGVRLAEEILRTADAVVFVLDATSPVETLKLQVAKAMDKGHHALVAANKIDLLDEQQRAAAGRLASDRVWPTSALTREGIEGLLAAIAKRIVPDPPSAGDAVPFAQHHREQIDAALAAIEAGDAPRAACALQRLVATEPRQDE